MGPGVCYIFKYNLENYPSINVAYVWYNYTNHKRKLKGYFIETLQRNSGLGSDHKQKLNFERIQAAEVKFSQSVVGYRYIKRL